MIEQLAGENTMVVFTSYYRSEVREKGKDKQVRSMNNKSSKREQTMKT